MVGLAPSLWEVVDLALPSVEDQNLDGALAAEPRHPRLRADLACPPRHEGRGHPRPVRAVGLPLLPAAQRRPRRAGRGRLRPARRQAAAPPPGAAAAGPLRPPVRRIRVAVTEPPDLPQPDLPGPGRGRAVPAASSFARSFLGAFARGTGLVAVALVIGIVLLQWSDASTDAAAGGQPPPAGTPVAPPESTTTTTTAPAGPRPPAQVAVLVLNATGKSNQAKPMSDRLGVVGYHTLTPGNAARRPDTTVLCRPGLEREAAA